MAFVVKKWRKLKNWCCRNRLLSKDKAFKQYILKENWGKDNVLLYKYIDYIFRCQSFARRIIQINRDDNGRTAQYLVFHTGLKRRSDGQYLFCLLAPNTVSEGRRYAQKWRVSFGNIRDSFLTQFELIKTLKAAKITMSANNLPKRTKFSEPTVDADYNSAYSIEVRLYSLKSTYFLYMIYWIKVSWEERLITNQDRIYKVIGNDAFFDRSRKFLKLTELIQAFNKALTDTQTSAKSNNSLVVPQAFVDTKNGKYRMELLLPLKRVIYSKSNKMEIYYPCTLFWYFSMHFLCVVSFCNVIACFL